MLNLCHIKIEIDCDSRFSRCDSECNADENYEFDKDSATVQLFRFTCFVFKEEWSELIELDIEKS